MKTSKRDVLDDLGALTLDLYAKSDDYLRNAKAYHCRANAEIRAGLIKGAAVMRMDAAKVQAVIDKHKDQPSGQASATRIANRAPTSESRPVEQVSTATGAQDGTMAAGEESPDQAAGPVDVRSLPASDA